MIQVFKIMNGMTDMNKYDLFVMKDVNINLRGHGQKIQKQRARLDLRKASFTHRVVDTWNLLPGAVVASETVNGFKNSFEKLYTKKHNKFTYGM